MCNRFSARHSQEAEGVRLRVEHGDGELGGTVQGARVDPPRRPVAAVGSEVRVARQQVVGPRRQQRADVARQVAVDRRDPLAREALARKPDYGFAHMSLGLALKQLGKKTEAVKSLEEAVRCTPEYADIHLHLAEALADAGRAADAVPRFEEALRLAPPDWPRRTTAEARLAELKKGG